MVGSKCQVIVQTFFTFIDQGFRITFVVYSSKVFFPFSGLENYSQIIKIAISLRMVYLPPACVLTQYLVPHLVKSRQTD